MSELKTEIDYSLKVPFSYANKGETTDASFIKLIAPSSKQSRECAALKQAFFRAVDQNQEADESATAESLEGGEVMIFLAMSKDVDLPDIIDIGKDLLLSPGIASVDGEAKLTKNLIEKMHHDDLECAIGEYIVNFILASSLAKMNAK